MSSNLYYALCFDKTEDVDNDPSNFYHCIAAAQNEDDFKTTVLKHRNVELTRISTVTDYLKESGYKKEILDLSGQVDDYNPIIFSDPVAFFTGATSDEESKLLEDEARPNGIVTLNVEYQEREEFMKQAKAWLLRQAGYECQDPRFSNIYTIIDQEAAEKSMLLVDAAQFPPNSIIYHFGDRMRSLYDGEKAAQMENVAPYLIDSQDIVDFLRNFKEESELIFRNEEQGVDYITEDAFKGVMLLKTDKSLDDVRRHLRRFTRIKSIDGYDDNGNSINERWLYFRFIEQLLTQEWLRCSEPEVTSYFMAPFDEILFARCDTCSFHRIKINKDKIISNPKYPNLNGGFLLTERQIQTFKNARKNHTIGRTENYLHQNFSSLLNERKKNSDHLRNYLYHMWNNFVTSKKTNEYDYNIYSVLGLFLGVDFMFDPSRQVLLEQYSRWDQLLDEHKDTLKDYYIFNQLCLDRVNNITTNILKHCNRKPISLESILSILKDYNADIYNLYNKDRLMDYFKLYFSSYSQAEVSIEENLFNSLKGLFLGINFYKDEMIGDIDA